MDGKFGNVYLEKERGREEVRDIGDDLFPQSIPFEQKCASYIFNAIIVQFFSTLSISSVFLVGQLGAFQKVKV